MLTIRFYPMGRKHRKFYRVVLTQKHKHVSKKFIKILGWYNPYTKEVKLDKEELTHYVNTLNVEVSPSVQSLLQKHSILTK